jgi:hypothetical protein
MRRAKTKPPAGITKVFDKEDTAVCIYEIHHKENKTIYYNRGGEKAVFPKITLIGFQGLPTGLYLNRKGYGIGRKGVFLLTALSQHFGQGSKPELVITAKPGKSLKKSGGRTIVTIPYDDAKNLLVRLGRINEENNNELRTAVASFLSTRFPRHIKTAQPNFDDYQSGEIAALLKRNDVAKKLNQDDLRELNAFLPAIFAEPSKGKKKVVQSGRQALLSNAKRLTDRIFLDDVIAEFNTNLARATLREEAWQKFLSTKVFKFMGSYAASIEKQNVSISVSYPDFVMVDVLGFVDVFEIKRHDTELLALDESHDNYYWKPEIAKAISQIENYIDEVVRNSEDYVRAVKRKKKVDIRVVRPRGYIIAGSSTSFETEKESADFHKLGASLKNINFILYDELLEKLKNIRQQLK